MGSSSGKEAEVSDNKKKLRQKKLDDAEAAARQKKLDDDLAEVKRLIEAERIKDAETIPLDAKGPNGDLKVDARLSGPLQELVDKIAAKFDIPKDVKVWKNGGWHTEREFTKHVEVHLSGCQLEPVTKIVREFIELCPVTCSCCNSRD